MYRPAIIKFFGLHAVKLSVFNAFRPCPEGLRAEAVVLIFNGEQFWHIKNNISVKLSEADLPFLFADEKPSFCGTRAFLIGINDPFNRNPFRFCPVSRQKQQYFPIFFISHIYSHGRSAVCEGYDRHPLIDISDQSLNIHFLIGSELLCGNKGSCIAAFFKNSFEITAAFTNSAAGGRPFPHIYAVGINLCQDITCKSREKAITEVRFPGIFSYAFHHIPRTAVEPVIFSILTGN